VSRQSHEAVALQCPPSHSSHLPPLPGTRAGSAPVDIHTLFRVVMDAELSPGGGGQVVGELLWEVGRRWRGELEGEGPDWV